MHYNFRKYDPHQLLLLPPNLDDWLPQQHLARFVADVVEALDLKPLLRRFRSNGQGGGGRLPPNHDAQGSGRRLVRFLLRGLTKVKGEFALWCLTHNLLKLYRHELACG